MINLLRPKKYQLFDFFELLIVVITFISSIISIYGFWRNDSPRFQIFAFSMIIAFAVLVSLKLWKIQTVASRRLKTFTEAFHKFTHQLRDELFSLKQLRESSKLDEEILLDKAKSTIKDCVNYISNSLGESTGEKVCVCLKYFPEGQNRGSNGSDNIEEHFVKTLAWSSNSSPERQNDIIERVGESTPLYFLMRERRGDFRAQDTKQVNEQLRSMGFNRYRDQHQNWKEHYQSVIVVPIRIQAKLRYNGKKGTGYDILGFLWADSESTSAFPKPHIEFYSQYLKAFADALYIYLDRLDFYLNSINNIDGG